MVDEVVFRVRRFDPSKDKAPRWQEYKVSTAPGMTVLDGLLQIKNGQDATLSFRRSCRSGICGSCAVKINGASRPCCNAQIRDHTVKGKVTVAPLDNLELIKDLIVDFAPFWDKMKAIHPYNENGEFSPSGKSIFVITADDLREVRKTEGCILCASCFSDCEALKSNKDYFGPAQMVRAYRFVHDPRDRLGRKRLDELKAISDKGAWLCAVCGNCAEVCPKQIPTMECFAGFKNIWFEELKMPDGLKATADNIEKMGRVYELDDVSVRMRQKAGLPPLNPDNSGKLEPLLKKKGVAK